MSKYIDADKTEVELWDRGVNMSGEYQGVWVRFRDIEEVFKNASAIYVAPVTHGYWTDTGSGQECSVCKEIQYGYDSGRHYCPNCGAKMQEQIQFQIIQDMYDLGFADKMG